MFQREELWNKWKNDGCQPFKKPIPPASVTATSTNEAKNDRKRGADDLDSPTDYTKPKKKKRPRRHIGDNVKDAVQNNRILMGQ